jgi:hypothetical protein
MADCLAQRKFRSIDLMQVSAPPPSFSLNSPKVPRRGQQATNTLQKQPMEEDDALKPPAVRPFAPPPPYGGYLLAGLQQQPEAPAKVNHIHTRCRLSRSRQLIFLP